MNRINPPIQHKPMKSRIQIYILTTTLAVAIAGSTLAADAGEGAAAPNPTGTWKVAYTPKSSEPTLKLKIQDDKLSGTLSVVTGGKTNDLVLDGPKLTGDEISFTVHQFSQVYDHNVLQPPDTNQMTHSKFQGKISGDRIKGMVDREYVGMVHTNRTLAWEATRIK